MIMTVNVMSTCRAGRRRPGRPAAGAAPRGPLPAGQLRLLLRDAAGAAGTPPARGRRHPPPHAATRAGPGRRRRHRRHHPGRVLASPKFVFIPTRRPLFSDSTKIVKESLCRGPATVGRRWLRRARSVERQLSSRKAFGLRQRPCPGQVPICQDSLVGLGAPERTSRARGARVMV